MLVSTRSNSVQTSSSPSTPLRDLWVQDVVAIKVNVTPRFTKNGVFVEEADCFGGKSSAIYGILF